MSRQSKLSVAIAKANGTYRKPGMGLDRRRKGGHHDWKTEVDAEGEFGSCGRSIPETRMIAAVIEDAVRVLCKGHSDKFWGSSTYMGYTRESWDEMYFDTVEWMFVEREPDSPFSLDWCIEALNAHLGLDYDVEQVRKRVRELNLVPEGDIERCVTSSLESSADSVSSPSRRPLPRTSASEKTAAAPR